MGSGVAGGDSCDLRPALDPEINVDCLAARNLGSESTNNPCLQRKCRSSRPPFSGYPSRGAAPHLFPGLVYSPLSLSYIHLDFEFLACSRSIQATVASASRKSPLDRAVRVHHGAASKP